jgi:hypothetical protein
MAASEQGRTDARGRLLLVASGSGWIVAIILAAKLFWPQPTGYSPIGLAVKGQNVDVHVGAAYSQPFTITFDSCGTTEPIQAFATKDVSKDSPALANPVSVLTVAAVGSGTAATENSESFLDAEDNPQTSPDGSNIIHVFMTVPKANQGSTCPSSPTP